MAGPRYAGFEPKTVAFLNEIANNNNREWFKANKTRYEEHVLDVALRFIQSMQDPLAAIAPNFVAQATRMGGSLMRVYRDTRFSKNKTPYKTNVGIQFRHELGKDVHAPGFYVHIQPNNCFLGTGIWRPDSDALAAIRSSIAEAPGSWKRVREAKRFVEHYRFGGDRLKRPPRGYAADHPSIEDLKRKDFIAVSEFPIRRIRSPEFVDEVAARYASAKPLMKFLCTALDLRF